MTRVGTRSLSAHLRYIVRDGTSRDGTPAQAFGADVESPDMKAFEERCHGDRHHFRFIVAPEDGAEIQDLREFTRELMRRMSKSKQYRIAPPIEMSPRARCRALIERWITSEISTFGIQARSIRKASSLAMCVVSRR
jgi:hypothetical protein